MNARWLYLAVSCLFATLVVLGFTLRDAEQAAPAATPAGVEVVLDATVDAAADDELQGVWTRWPDHHADGEKARFYYFHGDGHGLYRYGRMGHTNTNSYRYRITDGGSVELTFNKSGERYSVPFRIHTGRDNTGSENTGSENTGSDGRRVLRLEKDPREGGGTHEYFFVPLPASDVFAGPSAPPPPSGHMWICMRRYATGGQGFELYQFTPAGIDGRGTGWHHRGDFDDWSTETLTYRIGPQQLDLRFELTGEQHRTPYTLSEGADGKRRLLLTDDPRNFMHGSRFADMGRSFALGGLSAIWKLPAVAAADGGLPSCR